VTGEAGGHCRGAGPRLLSQAQVRPYKVVVHLPPRDLSLQASGRLGGSPGAAGQCGDGLAQGQVDPLHEGGLERAAPAEVAQGAAERDSGAALHLVFDAGEPAPLIPFVQLTVQEDGIDFPAAASTCSYPAAEVCRDGVEVEAEAVGGDHGDTGWRQSGAQGMDEGMRRVLGA
jgi:hypothetical protein